MREETSPARIIVEISTILPMFSAFFAKFRAYLDKCTVYGRDFIAEKYTLLSKHHLAGLFIRRIPGVNTLHSARVLHMCPTKG